MSPPAEPTCTGEQMALHIVVVTAAGRRLDDDFDDLLRDVPAHPDDIDWISPLEFLFEDYDVLTLFDPEPLRTGSTSTRGLVRSVRGSPGPRSPPRIPSLTIAPVERTVRFSGSAVRWSALRCSAQRSLHTLHGAGGHRPESLRTKVGRLAAMGAALLRWFRTPRSLDLELGAVAGDQLSFVEENRPAARKSPSAPV